MDKISLKIESGDLLAVVGENGAGKTTLMNVLYGLYQPDSGEVLFDGRPVPLRTAKDAIARGIGMVHQHFMLVPALSVVENVVLGAEPSRLGLIDLALARQQVDATCRRFGFDLDSRARIEDLSVGSQQKVEIVKALHRGAKVLILDEPTAVLTPQEADELFAVARQLSNAGHSIVFISHKLKEVLAVATRIAVMRHGRLVAEVPAGETSPQQLAELMVGESGPILLKESGVIGQPIPSRPAVGEEILVLRDVEVATDAGRRALQGVSLSVRSGEIVGIVGVDGNGQSELAEVVSGLRRSDRGEMLLGGANVSHFGPGELRRRGVCYIPEDRLRCAIIAPLTVEENAALGKQNQTPFAHGFFINFLERKRFAQGLLEEYDVRPRDEELPIRLLSGGNQQKVVVGRELSFNPKLVLAVQPTRGLDVGALSLVHERLRKARREGAAVLLVSLDLDEVVSLSDRIVVLYNGRLTATFERQDFDERMIGRYMLGAEGTKPRQSSARP